MGKNQEKRFMWVEATKNGKKKGPGKTLARFTIPPWKQKRGVNERSP